ncbi:unknown [Sinorhizobium phage PBC5]|nr:unknown [Sinorhizobium phage PBC5]
MQDVAADRAIGEAAVFRIEGAIEEQLRSLGHKAADVFRVGGENGNDLASELHRGFASLEADGRGDFGDLLDHGALRPVGALLDDRAQSLVLEIGRGEEHVVGVGIIQVAHTTIFRLVHDRHQKWIFVEGHWCVRHCCRKIHEGTPRFIELGLQMEFPPPIVSGSCIRERELVLEPPRGFEIVEREWVHDQGAVDLAAEISIRDFEQLQAQLIRFGEHAVGRSLDNGFRLTGQGRSPS